MAIGEDQLAVILQASLDRAKDHLENGGGFLPFGTRARPSGEVEFVEIDGAIDEEPVEELYRRITRMLAHDAMDGEILAAALVANAGLPQGAAADFDTAISVQIEARGFCRAIIVPYRIAADSVELGKMIPEEADPLVFATLAS